MPSRPRVSWTQIKLAEASEITVATVIRFERNGRPVAAEAVQVIQRGLESCWRRILCREWQRRWCEVQERETELSFRPDLNCHGWRRLRLAQTDHRSPPNARSPRPDSIDRHDKTNYKMAHRD
jgi:hypothetical protein